MLIRGEGSSNVDKLNVSIINFKKVDKPRRGGGWTMWMKFFVEFRPFSMLFGHFYYAYLVVFGLHLVIIKKKCKRD